MIRLWSHIINFSFDYLHHMLPSHFLDNLDCNTQLQVAICAACLEGDDNQHHRRLVMLIVITSQASSTNCYLKLQRCVACEQWLAAVCMHILILVSWHQSHSYVTVSLQGFSVRF